MERRKFLESSALGLGGLAMASARVASVSAEEAGESTQTKAIDTVRKWGPAKAVAYLKVNTNGRHGEVEGTLEYGLGSVLRP